MSYFKSNRKSINTQYLGDIMRGTSQEWGITEKAKDYLLTSFKEEPIGMLAPAIMGITEGSIKSLLENIFNGKRESILFIAAHRHDPVIFNYLVEHTTPLIPKDFIDNKGCDIYMHLLKDGDISKTKNLHLMPPPDFTRKDYKGRTLEDIAREENTLEMLEMLRGYQENKKNYVSEGMSSEEELIF